MFYKIYQVSDYIKELQIKNATQAKNIGISSNQLNNGDILTNNTRNIPNTDLKGNNSEIATGKGMKNFHLICIIFFTLTFLFTMTRH